MGRRPLGILSRGLLPLAAICLLFAAPAIAKNPYKAKDLRERLAADTGIDAAKIQVARAGDYAHVDPRNLYIEYDLIKGWYHDALLVEFSDAFGVFEFDGREQKWKTVLLATPGSVRGAKMVESGKRVMLRQIQFEYLDGMIPAVSYDGGLIGDNKYPLEAIKHLEAAGFAPAECIGYVVPRINTTTTIYY